MREIAGDVAIDLHVLAKLLRAEGMTVEGDLIASRVGQGQSNLTYLIEDHSRNRWVARRPPRGELLASAHDVVREHRILDALSDTNVPVPEAVGCFSDPALASAPVAVLEYVDGLVVDSMEAAHRMSTELRAQVGPALASTLAQIHQVDFESVGLGDLSSRAPYAARQIKRWSRQWEISRTRSLPRLEQLTELLHRQMPEQQETTLVHGDFYIRNVILDPREGQVRAVLDWELSTLGDPIADVGSMLAYWPEQDDISAMVFAASTLPGFATRDELVTEYLRASGRDRDHVAYWHAFGLWKLAVIGEGILRRALEDPRNAAEDGPPLPEDIEALTEQAWKIVEMASIDH